MKRNTKKYIKTKEKRHLPKKVIWFALLVVVVVSYQLITRVAEPALFPIKHIALNSKLNRVNPKLVQEKIGPHVKGFFSTSAIKMKNDILQIPFVEEVVIKRLWPDTLVVTLVEQEFVAKWGDEEVVSSKGDVVRLQADPKQNLPKFIGPEGQSKLMLEQYKLMTNALLPYNLTITLLNLNSRRSWQMTLNNGINVILGRSDVGTRLNTFGVTYDKLKKYHGDAIEVIDLRHPNGVCVRLKGAAL